ncbi:enoyl-CoA hydratase-related protein [Roseomonas sp. ACRSG]|nr:enoyl-CoA hydratase-related protein [Roseomonas sp. ACRSG]
MNDVLSTAIKGQVALLTLKRPEKLNALDNGLLAAIVAALDVIELNPAVRAVVITEAGRVFSAGADIAAFHVVWRPVRLRPSHVSCGVAIG